MTTQNLSLFKALGARMDYLNQRQRIIAQNIANSDTPEYRPQDLLPQNFDKVLKKYSNPGKLSVNLETTSPMHMPPPNEIPNPKAKGQKQTYEVAPTGNAVIMEEQMINADKTAMDYSLITNLYQKNVGMLRTALGRN